MKLTKAAIAALTLREGKRDHIEWDDSLPGFGVRLREGGKRTYIVQYRSGHAQRRETLGDVRKLDLDQARRAAKRKLGAVALGHDPAAEKEAARARAKHTPGAVLPRFIERQRSRVRPRSMPPIELHLLRRWAPLHGLPLHQISRRDIAARLTEIEAEHGANPARNARIALGSFFVWAMKEGLVEANPIIGTNQPPPVKARERVLSDPELAAIWHGCLDDDYGSIVQLLMLTGCRRDEIRQLRWPEIEGTMLRIPGNRTKNGRLHVLPLSPLAIQILENVPFCRLGHDKRVFGQGESGFGAWSQAKEALDARINLSEPWRLHDLRRTFASGLARLGVEIATIEQCLNHKSGTFRGIVSVYQRHDFIPEKRRALALWADHVRALVDGSERTVLPLRQVV
jgi:integrase